MMTAPRRDELALTADDPSPIDRFQLLDVYAAGGVAARIDALATISAGDRGPDQGGKPGAPRVSRDGTIMLHDLDNRAPGLRAALEATRYKKLTIALGFDDPELFLQQRFTIYSASALKVYGDQYRLMEIVTRNGAPQHVVHPVGSARYADLRQDCKVSSSLYFVLADWDENSQARVLMPDGLGFYRLRTTSRHSAMNILGTLKYLSKFTGGRLAGVPLELQITYREVGDPSGLKRLIPTWSLAMKPPNGIVLSTRNFADYVEQALAEGQALHLPEAKSLAATRAEIWEVAALEGPKMRAPDDADLARLLAGDAPADEGYWRRRWFASVRGSGLANDDARASWLRSYTRGKTDSLTTWLGRATNAQAEDLIQAVVDFLAEQADRADQGAGPIDDWLDEAVDGQVEGGAPDLAADDPDVGECDVCGLTTRLVPAADGDDEDEQYVCADRAGCEQRQREAIAEAELLGRAADWLEGLRSRIHANPRTEIAAHERRRAVGVAIQRATASDAAASRILLEALIGSDSLAKLTAGACDEIEQAAIRPDWVEMVTAAVKMLWPPPGDDGAIPF